MKKIFGLIVAMLLIPTLSFAEWIGVFDWKHYDAQGVVIWEATTENSLSDEGEETFLDCVLRGQNCPTTFYLGLVDNTNPCSITDTMTLTDVVALTEPSTNGYARQEITRNTSGWVTLALDGGDFQAISSQKTFVASGGSWGPVYCAFLTNVASGTAGKHYAYTALSQARTLSSGESLQVTYRIKLQ